MQCLRSACTAALLLASACEDPTSGPEPDAALAGSSWRPVVLTYMCGNTFRVRNSAESDAAVNWIVPLAVERGALTLRPRPADSAYSETFFSTVKAGTVLLYGQGTLLQAEANGRKTCPSAPRLFVVLEPGVVASTPLQDGTYPQGTVVQYRLAAEPGYQNLLVTLDGQFVPASGSLTMSGHHVVIASADRKVELTPGDEPLLASARAVLTSSDPVAAYQEYLDDVSEFLTRVPVEEAQVRLQKVGSLAYDPIADSAALRRVDQTLANHVFRAGGNSAVSPSAGRVQQSAATLDEPQPEPTTFLYVNGAITSLNYARATAGQVDLLTREVPRFSGGPYEVTYFYNRTYSEQAETFAQREARCAAELERRQETGSRGALLFMASCVVGRTRILFDWDLVEAFRQYASIISGSAAAVPDASDLAGVLQGYRTSGRHTIVVPHSQGNLMTQQAVSVLRSAYQFAESRDSTCVAAVSLAAPTDRNWPFPPERLKGVVLKGDIVPDIGGNAWPRVENDSSRAAEAELARLADLDRMVRESQNDPGLGPYIELRRVQLGLLLHRVVESYLLPNETRSIIQNDLVSAYGECAVGSVEVSPTAVSIAPGDSVQLSVTVKNQNGTALYGHKPAWTSSNSSVAAVDSTGWVRGAAVGSADITVRVGGFTATSSVLVEDGGGPVCGPECPPYDPNDPCSCV